VLSFDEIEAIIGQLDLSKPEGDGISHLETMYSCGLRVSEVVNLRISCLYLETGFIRVIGKGDKESWCRSATPDQIYPALPAGDPRTHACQAGNEDILFLNRRGSKLSRVMIF